MVMEDLPTEVVEEDPLVHNKVAAQKGEMEPQV
jgi:hypothetical protein